MLSLISDFDVTSSSKLMILSIGASILSGLWRIVIMPLDTLKTVCQVEGLDGLSRIRSKGACKTHEIGLRNHPTTH